MSEKSILYLQLVFGMISTIFIIYQFTKDVKEQREQANVIQLRA